MAVPGDFRANPSISRGHAYRPRKRLTATSDPALRAPLTIPEVEMPADRE
jgi:hypothetical protein